MIPVEELFFFMSSIQLKGVNLMIYFAGEELELEVNLSSNTENPPLFISLCVGVQIFIF